MSELTTQETFGQRVRRKRREKKITLIKFATMVDLLPICISLIERDELKILAVLPHKVLEIADALEENAGEMFGLADKVPFLCDK
jgi:transcriptional regulator with XRE-family HTH domain